MGCGGTKEKKGEDEPPMPKETKPTTDEKTVAKTDGKGGTSTESGKSADESKKKVGGEPAAEKNFDAQADDYMSPELKDMMQDYFNRYDLDGSSTINATEELKQLCTNLVVKLDLEMDVQEIDKLVSSAGDMTKNNWKFDKRGEDGQAFCFWFIQEFGAKCQGLQTWRHGDESSEEDDYPDETSKFGAAKGGEDHYFRSGTYVGVLLSEDGKQSYSARATRRKNLGAQKSAAGSDALTDWDEKEQFVVKIRYDEEKKGGL